jgi:two-component system cell cycle sensor histidine kinase/response regulator CckA
VWVLAAVVGVLLAGSCAVLMLVWRDRHRLRLFQEAVNAAPDPRQLVDPNGRPIGVNTAFSSYFGATDRPMPHVVAEQTSDPSTAQAVRRLARDAAPAGEARLEVSLDRADGAIWLELQALVLRDGHVFWVAHDITDRRRMADSMRAERARFVGLLEHAPVGFFSVDQDGRFLFANATLADWLGIPRQWLIEEGVHLHQIAPDSARAGVPPWSPFDPATTTAAEGETVHGEVVLLGWQGARFRAYVSQEIVPENDSQRFSTRSVVRNLSAERAYADALERSERRFRRLFAEAPVGIGFVDDNGAITECNTAFRDMLAPGEWRLDGRRLVDLVHPDDRAGVRTALTATGAAQSTTPEIRGQDSEGVCRLFVTTFTDAAGDSSHVAHLIDATEQKKLELQFAQSQKMQAVGQLAGGVAHDFNNLLTAMIGFCDLLLLRHRPGDQSFADLMQIKQNANRAASLVRQLLAFSRQQTLRPTVLSVTDVLAELTHLLRRLLGEIIELDISHGRDLYSVKVDQGQLEQVIINLAVNARDAMGEDGGHLTIRTQNVALNAAIEREGETVPPGEYVLIAIADDGHGIPRDHLDRIFEPFFSTKEVGGGTGLGLSTVYGIVKQTGGFILVDSTVGVGTTFRIYLPRYQETAAEAAAREREATQTRDLTGVANLLLVEDEDAVRSFAARALRKKGYTVTEASSGEEALQLLDGDGGAVDVLITDVVMPTIDGPTLVKRARERQGDLKVIFISGYTEDSFRQQLDSEVDVRFLSKPFSLKELASAVKQAIHGGDG